MMSFRSYGEAVLEALYTYRLSGYYKIHLVVVVFLGLLVLYLFLRECKYQWRAYNWTEKGGHAVRSERERSQQAQQHTAEEVRKLRDSAQYRNYLEDKDRPNSYYNRKIEVEEIVFSDEEDQQHAYEAKIYGQPKKHKKF